MGLFYALLLGKYYKGVFIIETHPKTNNAPDTQTALEPQSFDLIIRCIEESIERLKKQNAIEPTRLTEAWARISRGQNINKMYRLINLLKKRQRKDSK